MCKKSFYSVLLIIYCLICVCLNIITIYDGHNWGGDFSQYIIHAKNIISQREYGLGVMLNNPVVYPPGFPLLIAPIVKIFGVNFKILKGINIFFWYLSLFPIYSLLIRRMPKDLSVLFCMLWASSSYFFVFKQNVLSDIPFLFFCMSSIDVFLRYSDGKDKMLSVKNRWFFLFLLLMSYTFLIRSAGVTLVVAAAAYLLIMKRDWKKFFFVIFSFGLVFSLQIYFIGMHKGFFSEIFKSPSSFYMRILERNSLVLKAIAWFFSPGQTVLTEGIWESISIFIDYFAPIIYLTLGGIFFYKIWKRNISFIGLFFSFYLCLLVLWSGFEANVSGFVRYVLPIVIFFFIFLIEFFLYIFNKIHKAVVDKGYLKLVFKTFLIILIFCNIFNMVSIRHYNDDVILKEGNAQLFSWIKKNITLNERYMIWRPRPVALLTGRIGTVPWREDLHQDTSIYQRILDLKISYLILSKHVDQILIKSFSENKDFSSLVWENYDYKVFKVKKYGDD